MDWRLPLAILGVATVILGAVVIVGQVQQDLESGDLGEKDFKKTPVEGDGTQFKIKDLKVPQDLASRLPAGTQVSPDLSNLKLPEDLNVALPDNFDIGDLDLKLPEGTSVQLPEGAQYDGDQLKLPRGGQIQLPDGTNLNLPPGAALNDLPPGVRDAIKNAAGADLKLPPGASFTLPDGADLGLVPPKLPGGGSLNLPAGTQIKLPPGYQAPFPPGVLAAAAPFLIPAGALLDFPDEFPTGGAIPIPGPGSGGGGATTPPPTTPTPSPTPGPAPPTRQQPPPDTNALPTLVRIDHYPETVRKGEPVSVGGYGQLQNGAPLTGSRVNVYVNETRGAPGTLVGTTFTDGAGRFTIQFEMPANKPGGSYVIIAHLPSSNLPDGRTYAQAWS